TDSWSGPSANENVSKPCRVTGAECTDGIQAHRRSVLIPQMVASHHRPLDRHAELIFGHRRYHLTDVPLQLNSPPDVVFRTGRTSHPNSNAATKVTADLV
ncbi:hypothetical protein T265_13869, partial [Opisthorchis viverrini]